MSAARVTGPATAVELAGVDDAPPGAGVTITLGGGDGGEVIWLAHAPGAGGPGGARVIAPAGEGLWRRAPWPARDDLFELPPPAEPGLLVVGPDAARDDFAERLGDSAPAVAVAAKLDRAALEAAGVVVFAQEEGEPLPAAAPAVLAAGRILVVRNPTPAFGLLCGVDHLGADTASGMAELAVAAVRHWDAFRSLRAHARAAAEAHRASQVYARIAADVIAGR